MARLSAETVAQARELMTLYPDSRSALVPICHLAQAEEGWLSPEVMGLKTEIYDPRVHYHQVRDKWIGVRTPDGR